jgi:hypothetical protein
MNPNHLNIIKRRKKYIRIHLECEIRSKGQTKNKTEIQKEVIEQMKLLRKSSLNSDIAVQIITYTTDKKSPGIDKWIKNIIDILHKTEYLENSEDKIFLPFNDDKQIKYLFVQYIYVGEKSRTRIVILPFSGFISDLHKAEEIETDNRDDFGEYESNYQEILKNKDKYISFLSEEAYNSMLKTSLETEQRKFGDLISINSHFIRTCFPKKSMSNKYFRSIYHNWADLLLKTPIKLKLPGLPKHGSENIEIARQYKEQLRTQLSSYIDKYSIMKNLQGPIIISVIYRPAKNKIEKDIDNILLEYIMPITNDILCPPASLYRIKEFRDPISDEIKSVPLAKDKNGISIGYEIIRVPQFDNNEEGEIYLTFKLSSYKDSIIDNAQRKIDMYLKKDC